MNIARTSANQSRALAGLLIVALAAAGCGSDAADAGSTSTFAPADIAPIDDAELSVATTAAPSDSGDAEDADASSSSPADSGLPPSNCFAGFWPDRFAGHPGELSARLLAFEDAGLEDDEILGPTAFIWRNEFGLHVRVVSDSANASIFTVILTSATTVDSAVVYGEGDSSLLVADNRLVYTATSSQSEVGFDLNICKTDLLEIDVAVDGEPLRAGSIRLGRSSVAIDNPLRMERT